MNDGPHADSGPPWYDKDEHGRIDVLAVPERLRSHPEIQRRGIILAEPAKPVKRSLNVYSLQRLIYSHTT